MLRIVTSDVGRGVHGRDVLQGHLRPVERVVDPTPLVLADVQWVELVGHAGSITTEYEQPDLTGCGRIAVQCPRLSLRCIHRKRRVQAYEVGDWGAELTTLHPKRCEASWAVTQETAASSNDDRHTTQEMSAAIFPIR